MTWKLFALLVCVAVLTLGCAPTQNPMTGQVGEAGRMAGFWLGFWHGMISPYAWIVSLFDSSVGIYEVHNNGSWYNFGFVLGIGGSLNGVSTSITRRRRSVRGGMHDGLRNG